MKITTQRSLIWMGNLLLALVMMGIIVLMVVQKRQKFALQLQERMKPLEDRLKKVVPPSSGTAGGANDGEVIATVLANSFAGYIPPVKPQVQTPTSQMTEQAPDLNGLIEVAFVIAGGAEWGSGPNGDVTAGAMVRVKSKAGPEQTALFYRVGESIGINETDRTGTVRKDEDPQLKKFGGARIVRVDSDGIVCEWGGKEKKEVTISIVTNQGKFNGMLLTSLDGKTTLGSISGSTGASTPATPEADLGTFTAGNGDASSPDKFDISEGGLKSLVDSGDKIIDGVTFEQVEIGGGPAVAAETTDGAKEGAAATPAQPSQIGLKVRSLPRELVDRGLREGDVITRIDDRNVSSKESIIIYVKGTYRSKQSYTVHFLRDGNPRIVQVAVPKTSKEAQGAGRRLGLNR